MEWQVHKILNVKNTCVHTKCQGSTKDTGQAKFSRSDEARGAHQDERVSEHTTGKWLLQGSNSGKLITPAETCQASNQLFAEGHCKQLMKKETGIRMIQVTKGLK